MSHKRCLLLLLGIALLLPQARAVAQIQDGDPVLALADASVKAVPLVVWNRTVVMFRATVGGVPPKERAVLAADRLTQLSGHQLELKPHLMTLEIEGLQARGLVLGNQILFIVAPGDGATVSGESLDKVALKAVEEVSKFIGVKREAIQTGSLLHSIWKALLLSVVVMVLLWIMLKIASKVYERLTEERFGAFPKIAGIESKSIVAHLLRGCLKLFFLLILLGLLYFWAFSICECFPYTRPWADVMGDNLLKLFTGFASSMIHALPNLITIIFIFVMTRFVSRLLGSILESIELRRVTLSWIEPEIARATRRIATILLWLFALTVAYPYFPGSSTDAFKGISVFAGLMLTLGSAGLVNQVMSGLVVVYSRSLSVGDVVKVGEVRGTVLDVGFLTTKFRTPEQQEISIPNAVLVSQTMTNYSRSEIPGAMMATVQISIGYDTPWRLVHELLIKAAEATKEIRKDPSPVVVQKMLGDFYVEYELRAYTASGVSIFNAQTALRASIQDQFNEHGVQIMSPHYEMQPERPVLVKKESRTGPSA